MRIALVNDMKLALAALRQVVESIPGAEIAWMAEDGAQAFERCRADRPDLVLMDMIMPGVDGVEATRRIMQSCPCPIVVVTATVEGNASLVYDALGHGALDAVCTPTLGAAGDLSGAADLIRKIRTVEALARSTPAAVDQRAPAPATCAATATERVLAVGSSTGGPQALNRLFSALPRPLPWPALIAQHVDPAFAPGLADWLARETRHPVRIAEEGVRPEPGVVHIASTEDHLVLDRQGRLQYTGEPADLAYRPSVDVLFQSLLEAPVRPSVAVLLTGMGRDGAAGLLSLRERGWHTIAQDEATSVVWGMPRAAIERNAAVDVLGIDEIGRAIAKDMASRAARGADDE